MSDSEPVTDPQTPEPPAVDPRLGEARALTDSGRYDDAMSLFQALLSEGKHLPNAHMGVGVVLLKQEKYAEAAAYFMGCGVDSYEFYLNASTAYEKAGDEDKQYEALKRLLTTRQRQFDFPYRKLAVLAEARKDLTVVYETLLLAFEFDGDDFAVCFKLAETCKKLGKHKQALTFALKAAECRNDDPDLVGGIDGFIAGLYKDCGELDKGLKYFRDCYEAKRDFNAASNLIMSMQYTHGIDLKEFYAQCKEYSDRFLRYLRRYTFALERLDPEKAKKGLRIGFSSGDFVRHSLANLLLEPTKRFKEVAPQHTYILYCYREPEKEDDVSEQYKSAVDIWRNVFGKTHAEIAKLIHEDEVDVLVEIAGHTAYNILPTFGYKPAPVQVSWVSGMMTPPAIETINYFMTDQWIRPDCAEEVCFEKLFNLPAAYCYFPLADAPELNPELPADRKGHITFASLNNPCKLNDETLRVYATCLKNVPDSKLFLKVYSNSTEKKIRIKMASFGISGDRLGFVYYFPKTEDMMRYYTEEVDIVLDTWPCAGCLTSAEAMWMGPPVITYYGETFLHRQSWTILNQIGLPELGSNELEGFCAAAIELAKDRSRLRDIRKSIRDKMKAAPIRDPLGMARGVISSLEGAWEDWCISRQPLADLRIASVT